jgi:hypothetical protein
MTTVSTTRTGGSSDCDVNNVIKFGRCLLQIGRTVRMQNKQAIVHPSFILQTLYLTIGLDCRSRLVFPFLWCL